MIYDEASGVSGFHMLNISVTRSRSGELSGACAQSSVRKSLWMVEELDEVKSVLSELFQVEFSMNGSLTIGLAGMFWGIL